MLPQVENEIATWYVAEKKTSCLNYLQMMHFQLYVVTLVKRVNKQHKKQEVLTEKVGSLILMSLSLGCCKFY